MNIKDKIYLSDKSTIKEVEAAFSKADMEQLKAYGDVNDDRRWGAGDMALKYIELGFPVKQVLVIIAKHTDCSIHSVKKYLACSRYYSKNPKLRKQAGAWLRYSIMAHAAKYHEPKQVIDYAIQHNSSYSEIETLFPVIEITDDTPHIEPSIFGIELKAFKRWGYGLFKEQDKRRVVFENLLDEFIHKLQELMESK